MIKNLSRPKNPFCQHNWKLSALAMFILLCMTTFGAFFLYNKYEDDFFEFEFEHRAGHAQTASISSPAMQQKLESAVVGINSGGDYASGVIVHPDGYIISVLHSIKDKKDIRVTVRTNNQSKEFKGEVLKQLPEHDIVLIKLVTNQTLPYIALTEIPAFTTANIFALATKESGQFIMQSGANTTNETSITIQTNNIKNLVQSTAIYTWEQNGGPMVNDKGDLLGINLAIKDSQGNIHGLMIPVKIMMTHLQDVVPLSPAVKRINKDPMATTDAVNGQFRVKGQQLQQPAQPQLAGQQLAGQQVATQQVNAPLTLAQQQNQNAVESQGLAVAWWVKARQQVNMANNRPIDAQPGQPSFNNIAFVDPQHSPTRALSFLDVGNQHPLKFGSYELNDIIAMMMLGLIAGIMGTVAPLVGGLFIVVAMYDVMNYDFYLARPVIYFSMLFMYSVIVIRYRLSKKADQLFTEHPIMLQLPWIVFGTIVGFLLGNLIIDKIIIMLLTILIILVLFNLFRNNAIEKWFSAFLEKNDVQNMAHDPMISDKHLSEKDAIDLLTGSDNLSPKHNQWLHRALAAFPVSFSSGLFAVYTGAISMQSHVNGLKEEKARANAAQLIFFASLTGAIISTFHGMENSLFKPETPLLLAMILIPPTFGGVFVANYLLKFIKMEHLKIATGVILFLSSLLMLFSALNNSIV